MAELRCLYYGGPNPHDRKMRNLALELVEGIYPFEGDFRDQPMTIQDLRRLAIETREVALAIGARMATMTAAAGKAKRGR